MDLSEGGVIPHRKAVVMLDGERKEDGQAKTTDVHSTLTTFAATSNTIRRISSQLLELYLPPENPQEYKMTILTPHIPQCILFTHSTLDSIFKLLDKSILVC